VKMQVAHRPTRGIKPVRLSLSAVWECGLA
jgi:hypothetical protein